MSIKLQLPKLTELRPLITVVGVGGAGGNAINNMIASGIDGVDFVAANTDAQALASSSAERRLQLGINLTEGLGAGARPDIGQAAAEEAVEDIRTVLAGSHMVFIAAGMGGGTGTGATAVIARVSRELGMLTVGVVTKPFNFEGSRRQRTADIGIAELRKHVDTLIVIPNQNLFRIANERTTFAEAFVLADQVLHSGIACITDLIVREGLINLDFADVRAVMSGMGTAMMGTGEAAGPNRAIEAAELAILNPLLDDISLSGAKGLLVSISGDRNITLYEVDEAASRVRQEVDGEANVIIGATFDESLGDKIRVSIVASGMERLADAAFTGRSPAKSPPTPQAPPRQAMAQSGSQRPAYETAIPSTMASNAYQQQRWQDGPIARDDDSQYRAPGAATHEDVGDRALAGSQPWRGPGDVVIELGVPRPSASLQSWPDEHMDPAGGQANTSTDFSPAPPQETRRSQRRLPEVEDFPEFAQRAYREARQAKSAPPTASHPVERRRGGLFARLTAWRKATDSGDPAAITRDSAIPDPGENSSFGQSPGDIDPADLPASRIPMPRRRPR
jgi:cell division protein FtsZ